MLRVRTRVTARPKKPQMIKYKTIEQFAKESGYTAAAIRCKIKESKWPEGGVWKRAPDGRVLIDVEGYNQWVENSLVSEWHQKPALRSTSATAARSVAKGSSLSPRPPT
ncbi:conserved hypothetical protein [Candidatus Nitrotoga sp. M5]|nr:conserved hypothetical protein [Candidatus Nitrotoga sp. M5]